MSAERRRLAVGLGASFACAAALAAGDWEIRGSNTVRLEQYDAFGPGAGSPYPFEGVQVYDEIGLSFRREDSPWDRWYGQVYGVVNSSEYRSRDQGVVPERLSLTREKGDAAIPYRLELGDHFSYFSYRTLQRSLKGVQLELQPRADAWGNRHSIITFAGVNQPRWPRFRAEDDWSAGGSWLIDTGARGVLAFNLVHNHRDGRVRLGTLERDQTVLSAAVEKAFKVFAHALTFEAEVAHLEGDHDGVAGAASGQDRSGSGYFAELRGVAASLPFDWRLRAEHYDQDFRPRGGVVTPDRRSLEAHAAWRFANGMRLRARLQGFDDGFETASTLRTRTAGATLSGPLLGGYVTALTGTVDAFHSRRWNDGRTVDQEIINLNASLTKPLPGGWVGRLGVFLQELDDDSAADFDLRTRQVHLSADHVLNLGGFTGVVTPGLLVRVLDDSANAGEEVQPTLGLRLNRDRHSLGFDYGFLNQARDAAASFDVRTHTVALDYRYARERNVFGLEFNWFGRDPDPGEATDAYRVSLYWTHHFERPATAVAVRGYAPIGPVAAGPVRADPMSLAPGLDLAQVLAELEASGVTGGVELDGLYVFEHPVLAGIDQRQRLVLLHGAGVLDGAAVIVDFDDVGNVDSVAQTFERVREALIDRYGAPARVFEEGELGPAFVADVNAQRLIRVSEWDTPAGVLRFGIPRRLDGQVRMEVQHRRRFPEPYATLWSVDRLR